jgi:2,3-dihydroxybiphenyl 1,2-dioxygenase
MTTSDHSPVLGLGYVGLDVRDLSAWIAFATAVLGLQPAESPADTAYFKMDHYVWRLALHLADAEGPAYFGWEVRTEHDLYALEKRIADAGKPTARDAALARERRVLYLFSTADPAGNRLEFYVGPQTESPEPFLSPTGASFVTGDQGMGHLTFEVNPYRETVEFYRDVLGFTTSDITSIGASEVIFLGCNRRHHSIGLLGGPDFPATALHHVMVETTNIDHVGRAYDTALDGHAQVVQSLGRHWNDHMTSFYVKSPSGITFEYGWGGRTIDRQQWSIEQGNGATSIWGHRPIGAVGLGDSVGAAMVHRH